MQFVVKELLTQNSIFEQLFNILAEAKLLLQC